MPAELKNRWPLGQCQIVALVGRKSGVPRCAKACKVERGFTAAFHVFVTIEAGTSVAVILWPGSAKQTSRTVIASRKLALFNIAISKSSTPERRGRLATYWRRLACHVPLALLSTQESDSTWVASLDESPGTVGVGIDLPLTAIHIPSYGSGGYIPTRLCGLRGATSWGFSAGGFERNVHLGRLDCYNSPG